MFMLRCSAAAILVTLGGAAAALAQPLPSPAPMLADAELTSVSFVDADHGWAVGDRGVIWATSDGGRSWQLQQSPTSGRLECVQFLDTLNGWAVGGYTHPYTHHTSGIVVRTRDGGRTWQLVPELTLPALKHVEFSDARRGWAAGDPSPLYASGIFRTEDGGREWTPVPKGTTLGWSAADFRDAKSGILVDRGGQTAVATAGEVRPSRTARLDDRPLRRMVLASPQDGWLVGDGGQVLASRDGGFTWLPPPGPLPAGAGDFDYRAVAVHRQHCWIAGNPGTCVLHSADGGQSWESFRTEQRVPIQSLTFVDESRGWAVGSLGTILVTRDGGRNWRTQRSGGARVAMLAIFSEPGRLPLEVIAQQSASEGFLSVAEIIGRSSESQDDPRLASQTERTHEGFAAAGGSHASTAWRFPLPPGGLALTPQALLERWNAANQGRGMQLLEDHLVRRIRTWRPEVIVTENVSPRGSDPLAHVTSQLVLSAVEKAADAAAFPEQLADQGLDVWKVKKVFGVQSGSRPGTVNITPSQWSARLARSLADVAESGRSIVAAEPSFPPTTVGLSLLVDQLPQNSGRRDVFSGILLLAGGDGRRMSVEPPAGNLDKLAQAAQKRHNVEQLLSHVGEDSSRGAAMLAQIGELTDGIGDRGAGEILLALAHRYHAAGMSVAAADTLQLLIDRYPRHPLADSAALWLVQYYSSGEMAWRQRKPSPPVVLAAALSDEPPSEPRQGAKPNSAVADRAARAIAAGRFVERTRPVLFADPRVRFPLIAACRSQGDAKQADQLFAGLAASGSAWSRCADSEQCLRQGRGTPPSTIIACTKTAQRPQLDGRLDDEIWKTARPASLAGSDHPDLALLADAVLAYDEEFLYLAVSCQKAPEGDYAADAAPRTHDADLSRHDRVELHLDIDRDYATFWTLAVDCRGCTADRVFGDSTWNPTWYVATGGDAQYWTAEIAIPISQLAPHAPKARDAWAVGIQRLIPNVGFQSATQPASVDVRPEGFGLLMFE